MRRLLDKSYCRSLGEFFGAKIDLILALKNMPKEAFKLYKFVYKPLVQTDRGH